MTRLLMTTMAALLIGSACEAQKAQKKTVRSRPKIVSLSPDSSMLHGAITEIVIHGRRFERGPSGRNTVQIGPVVLTRVPANSAGTEIRVVVPEEYSSGGEAPPSAMQPGTYSVTVRTRGGVSNAKVLRVVQ